MFVQEQMPSTQSPHGEHESSTFNFGNAGSIILISHWETNLQKKKKIIPLAPKADLIPHLIRCELWQIIHQMTGLSNLKGLLAPLALRGSISGHDEQICKRPHKSAPATPEMFLI